MFAYDCCCFLLSKTPPITVNDHGWWIKVKHLPVRPNQQNNSNCERNNLVPTTPRSRLNHTILWLVTVLVWFSYVKKKNYEGIPSSFTAVNNVSRWNWYFGDHLLTLVDIWCLKYEFFLLLMLSIQEYENKGNKWTKHVWVCFIWWWCNDQEKMKY